MITKDTIWQTYEGVRKPLKECEDTHLANIVLHVNKYRLNNKIALVCIEILKERGISIDFTKFAQIPHKDKDGHWACWDYENHSSKKLQKGVVCG